MSKFSDFWKSDKKLASGYPKVKDSLFSNIYCGLQNPDLV